MERNKYVSPTSNHVPGFDINSVVDADLYVEDEDGRWKIGFHQALDYANDPLDEDTIRSYVEERSRHSMMRGRESSSIDSLDRMRNDYFDHVTSFNYRLVLEDKNGSEFEFIGQPRTDLENTDFATLIFPNIITFQAVSDFQGYDPEDNPHLVMREMAPYPEEIERSIISDAGFMGEDSYDNEVAEGIRGTGHSWIREPDNFVYVDEPRDFIALNGKDGIYEEIRDTEIPEITVSDWNILSIEDEEIIGIRPFFHEIWDSGLKQEDAEKLGRWRGINRGIGRWVYDMDDEFFYVTSEDSVDIGFYDNEMPIAVGSDQAFEGDIRNIHNQRVKTASGTSGFVEEELEPIMKKEEERMAEKIEELGITYTDFVPRKVDPNMVPEDMKADNLF